jgi:hypothetical protein
MIMLDHFIERFWTSRYWNIPLTLLLCKWTDLIWAKTNANIKHAAWWSFLISPAARAIEPTQYGNMSVEGTSQLRSKLWQKGRRGVLFSARITRVLWTRQPSYRHGHAGYNVQEDYLCMGWDTIRAKAPVLTYWWPYQGEADTELWRPTSRRQSTRREKSGMRTQDESHTHKKKDALAVLVSSPLLSLKTIWRRLVEIPQILSAPSCWWYSTTLRRTFKRTFG